MQDIVLFDNPARFNTKIRTSSELLGKGYKKKFQENFTEESKERFSELTRLEEKRAGLNGPEAAL